MKDGYLKKLINIGLYIVMWVGSVIGVVVIVALLLTLRSPLWWNVFFD